MVKARHFSPVSVVYLGLLGRGGLTQALARAIPLGRLGRPEDYPGLVAFLLSDDASFITEQTISVSGGLTMHG